MRQTLLSLMLFAGLSGYAQYQYEATTEYPYGQLNPAAPEQTNAFGNMVGKYACKSVNRVSQTEWADTVAMTWVFKYIMNGMAVQDETLKEDGKHSGSIRQYNADSSRWYVHYYSSTSATPSLATWEGNLEQDGNIYLYKDQSAPNGTPGWFKITFSDIDGKGFNWLGEWVNKSETFSYPTWKILCNREH